jgi:exodeoxyribonuclease VII small subunit
MAVKKKKTFEESMDRLEEIVADLESNEKPLDETVALFEEGLDLVKNCDAKLREFETRVDEIIQKKGDGQNEA